MYKPLLVVLLYKTLDIVIFRILYNFIQCYAKIGFIGALIGNRNGSWVSCGLGGSKPFLVFGPETICAFWRSLVRSGLGPGLGWVPRKSNHDV